MKIGSELDKMSKKEPSQIGHFVQKRTVPNWTKEEKELCHFRQI